MKHGSAAAHRDKAPQRTALVFDAATGKAVSSVIPLSANDFGIDWKLSPDGKQLLAFYSDDDRRREAHLWHVDTHRSIPLPHGGSVNDAAFSPDGTLLLTAGDDGTVRLWNAATGEPARPPMRHEGKVERGVDYVRENALRGRTFATLEGQNRFLRDWELTVADTRVHGTTRRHVGKHFLDIERPELLPLPPDPFPSFREARRTVHRDGHVEVERAYYSAP